MWVESAYQSGTRPVSRLAQSTTVLVGCDDGEQSRGSDDAKTTQAAGAKKPMADLFPSCRPRSPT